MSHVRHRIRDAIKSRLIGLPLTENRVYASHVYPIDMLPAISVFAASEAVTEYYDSLDDVVQRHERDLEMRIEIRERGTASMDGRLDSIAAQVEAALAADRLLGGLAVDMRLRDTTIELSGDSEQPAGLATLRYAVMYRVLASDPETVLV